MDKMTTPNLPKPLEVSGTRSAARFEYQHHVCALLALEAAIADASFTALFDHIEDFVKIQEGGNLYVQIKGKSSGAWTPHTISKEDTKKSGPNGIVGKLLYCLDGRNTDSAWFVTNAAFNAKLKNNSHIPESDKPILLSNLSSAALARIENNLSNLPFNQVFADASSRIAIRRLSCPTTDYNVFVVGKVAEIAHLKSLTIDAVTLTDTLISMIRQKATCAADETNHETIKDSKGINGNAIISLFSEAARLYINSNLIAMIKADLASKGFPMLFQMRITTLVGQWLTDRRTNSGPYRKHVARTADMIQGVIASDDPVSDALQILEPNKTVWSQEEYEYSLAGAIMQLTEKANENETPLPADKVSVSQ